MTGRRKNTKQDNNTAWSRKTFFSGLIFNKIIINIVTVKTRWLANGRWATSGSLEYLCRSSSRDAMCPSSQSRLHRSIYLSQSSIFERPQWSVLRLKTSAASYETVNTCLILMPFSCSWILEFSRSSSIAKWAIWWSKRALRRTPWVDSSRVLTSCLENRSTVVHF